MDKVLVRRLRELGAERVWLGATAADLQREIAENCWSISASEEELSEVTAAEMVEAMEEVIECRRAQVSSRECQQGAIFYTWCDGQASQLRCCLISNTNSGLPFGRDIERVSSVLPIVEEFLASSDHLLRGDMPKVPYSEAVDTAAVTTPLKVHVVLLS